MVGLILMVTFGGAEYIVTSSAITILMGTKTEAHFHQFSIAIPINSRLKGLGLPTIYHTALSISAQIVSI